MEGQYVRLEPLDAKAHGDDLFAVTYLPDREVRFLFWHKQKSPAPANREEFQTWMNWAANSRQDPLIFAVIDKATGANFWLILQIWSKFAQEKLGAASP